MKAGRRVRVLSCLVGLGAVAGAFSAAVADNRFSISATIYRGDTAMDGETCDFEFSLFSLPAAGVQIGATQTALAVPVTRAAFATSVDFGDVFSGPTLYLQTAAKCGSDVSFTQFAQRAPLRAQPLTQTTAALRNGDLDPAASVSIVGTPGNGVLSVRKNLGGSSYNEVTVNAQAVGGNAAIAAQSDTGAASLDLKYGNQAAMRITEDPNVAGQALAVVGPAGLLFADQALASDPEVAALPCPPGSSWYCPAVRVGLTTHFATASEEGNVARAVAPTLVFQSVADNVSTDLLTINGATRNAVFQGDVNARRLRVTGDALVTAGASPVVELSLSPNVTVTAGVPISTLELTVDGEVVDKWSGVGVGGQGAMTNRVSGSPANLVDDGKYGCVIAGGGTGGAIERNHCTDDLCTISGGFGHTGGFGCLVGSGRGNSAGTTGTQYDVVVGGRNNSAIGGQSAVGGGLDNTAEGARSAVAGGENNHSIGRHSLVPGGANNVAGGYSSLAAGWRGKVRTAAEVGGGDIDGDQGTFVWADSTNADFISDGPDRFLVRAAGGATIYSNGGLSAGVTLAAGGGSWSSVSDRNLKENVAEIDKSELLQKLAAIPVTTWNYKSQDPSIRHIGPMGQDFHAAFGVGETDTRLSTIDVDGVALAAIQGLFDIAQEKNCRIEELKDQNAELTRRNAELEARVAAIEAAVSKVLKQSDGGSR